MAALIAVAVAACAAPPTYAAGEHDHHSDVTAPAVGDARFMPGTVGPVVFRGTAATVSIPDGAGFGGEKGRTQNSGDLRKNNYSVTDANFSNVLGLLDRNPDTGAPLTYVQHIQTYAAAGFIETFAPHVYGQMVARQNAGQGTILGASAYLMGLVARQDAAAAGLSRDMIPAKLPGTDIDAELYVRATRDATGQQWARMHHAQTAPGVYLMLLQAGIQPGTALVLASDDGISGAGRLNGVNEQNGTDGFNDGERSTWALAAQVQQQTGIPVVWHLMHGHDHAGIDASAMTRPRINGIIGYASDDRSATAERAAAIQGVLSNGRVASAATAAADTKLVLRNEAYLTNHTKLDVDMEWFDYMQTAGTVHPMTVTVTNHGPHVARNVMLDLSSTSNVRIEGLASADGVHCSGVHCHIGDLPPHWSTGRRQFTLNVRFVTFGKSDIRARVSSTSKTVSEKLAERHEHAAKTTSFAALSVAAASRGWKVARCGTRAGRPCTVQRRKGISLIASVRPAREGNSGRWGKAVFYRKKGKRWVREFDRSGQVSSTGRVRIEADRWSGWRRGTWRVQLTAHKTWLLGEAQSRYTYLRVR